MPASRRLPSITALVEDVADLRAFGLVVDLQSVTAAAAVLGESKATTSRRISRLETSLGVSLLTRTSRVVDVTDEGRAYRQRIGEVLELLAHANEYVRSAHAAPHGDLRVAAPLGFQRLLGPLVAAYCRHQPTVRVEVIVTHQTLDLDMEELDVAFTLHTEPGSDDVELLSLNNVFVASPQYIKEHSPKVTSPADLTRHTFVTHNGVLKRNVELVHTQTGRQTSVRLKPALSSTDLELVMQLALDGAGIALVPAVIAAPSVREHELLRVLPHHETHTTTMCLRQRRNRFVTPKVSSFRAFTRDYVRSLAF